MLAHDMIKTCATDITDIKYNQLDIVTEVDPLLFQPHNQQDIVTGVDLLLCVSAT